MTARNRPSHAALALVRVLLLAAVLLGVGAMHTLGHHMDDTRGTADSPDSAVVVADDASHTAHADSNPPPMDPTSMCLAIGGLAIALLGLAAAVFVRWPGVGVPPPQRWRSPALRSAPSFSGAAPSDAGVDAPAFALVQHAAAPWRPYAMRRHSNEKDR